MEGYYVFETIHDGVETPKSDCFAYISDDVKKGCNCMSELVCSKKKCSFYKTQKEFKEGLTLYPVNSVYA